jgi:peptidase A4-like protein
MRNILRRASVVAAGAALACAIPASAQAALQAHGQRLRLSPHATVNTNQSTNWFGYNQGTLEKGNKLFHSISGNWVVPTATQHKSGQAEASSDWIGIGGGCVDAGCTVTDNTLIQTGTEQDVAANGKASYGAWWEIIPGPSLTISGMTVKPGDHMSATIAEAVANSDVWKITLKDVTRGKTFTQTVPYPSTHLSAEWIEETPLSIGTSPGLSPLPNLTKVAFTGAKTNGAAAGLTAAERMVLTDSSGRVIGTPSLPSGGTAFSACAWSTTC